MADEKKDDKISERLERIQQTPRRAGRWKPYAAGAGLFVAGAAIASYGFLMAPTGEEEEKPFGMATSQVSEFQDGSGLDGFTISRPRPDSQGAPQARPAPEEEEEPPADDPRLADLNAQIMQLQSQLGDRDEDMEALRTEIEAAKQERAERDRALQEAERNAMRLQSQLETQKQLFEQQQVEQVNAEQRRAELEARRAEQEAIEQAQISSAMVAYRASGSGSSGGEGGRSGGEGESRDYEGDEAFLRAAADKAAVTRSEIIANPSNTIIQGTQIEATLETGIDTSLQGNIVANVSYDVWSMDMSQVLIPRGSKLFGRYNGEIEQGQRRVLIAWDRLVTSDGQSVNLEGYGTDRIGRSGMTGKVNNHTWARFGSAAAVSIVGALPAILAAGVEDESSGEVSSDTVENIGQNASEAVSQVVATNLNRQPTITVHQGAVVMVRINHDIEMF